MKIASRIIGLAACCILAGFLIWYVWFRNHPTTAPAGRQAAGDVYTPQVVGIGVALGAEGRTIKIVQVLSNTPAARAGLSPGLVIQKIDDTATEGMFLKDYVEMLRGPVNTKVRLELVDMAHTKTNTVELIRERVQ